MDRHTVTKEDYERVCAERNEAVDLLAECDAYAAVDLDYRGSPFEEKVLAFLSKVKHGQTL